MIGKIRWTVAAALAVGALAAASPAAALAEEWSVTELGTLGGNRSEALDVNDLGQVVGFTRDDPNSFVQVPFLWTAGEGMVRLKPLSALVRGGEAHGINSLGQVVGTSFTDSSEWHAVLWKSPEEVEEIDTPDAWKDSHGRYLSKAFDINDHGQIVGMNWRSNSDHDAWLWTPGVGMIDLGTLGGATAQALAINNYGEVVGRSATASGETRAFIWTAAGGMRDLGKLGGISGSAAYDINDLGEVAGGSSSDKGVDRPFLWTAAGGMVELPVAPVNGSVDARGIDELGRVVGRHRSPLNVPHAYIWSPTGGTVDLGGLGGRSSRAYAVNHMDYVVGWSESEGGDDFAALWTPQPLNSPPTVVCQGGGTIQAGDPAVLGGEVSDGDGDEVLFEWETGGVVVDTGIVTTAEGGAPSPLPETILTTGYSATLELGQHTLTLTVDDDISGMAACTVDIEVIDTEAPSVTADATPALLWPPDHEMHEVVITIEAVDASGGPVTLTATVESSESDDGAGDGATGPDTTEPVIDPETGVITLDLRAERSGGGGGRTYTVTITATDPPGNSATTTVTIAVAHDRGK